MNRQLMVKGLSFATLAIAVTMATKGSVSATFGEKPVEQGKFVAVAVPLKGNAYKFMIVEQVSAKKKCWETSGTNPTKVNLLLFTYDFTGICNRSLDSNGYSLRSSGQDLGLNYFLTIEQRKDELVLVGAPRIGQAGAKLEVARTQGLDTRYPTQLILDPKWQFARRTFKDKPLGHIYLSQR
jgi:N-acetylmuramoyl-L-alanine amidase